MFKGGTLMCDERVIDEQLKKDAYLFNSGQHFRCYHALGCHRGTREDVKGFRLTTWAPNAQQVSVVSDFTDWESGQALKLIENTGFWTGFFPTAQENDCYKFKIIQADGTVKLKSDPFAFAYEVRPKDASVVKVLPEKTWSDNIWMANRKRLKIYERPLNIYEVHLSSWKHHEDGSWYSLKDLQAELIPYVKEMGYTHIEFMPVMEHPLDRSWGYQITGFFGFSSKYGTMEDFQDFVEACHQQNIGVLVDWVPSHFNRNDYAMAYFDGTPQFEYADPNRANNNRWGTLNFDLGKPQVHSFLISNALFWLDIFHLDGIRVDAVSNMLYLDYDDGPWTPNEDGTNENRQGVAFIQKMNRVIFNEYSDVLMMAEESTAYPGVTAPVHEGGLGFNYKWNMGWMNDTLKFFEMDPEFRKYHLELITFSFMYVFNENFILPFSHDEVVHGKKSLMHKMFGDRYNQFAGLRTIETFRMTHPGKNLHFMGAEYGQFLEWDAEDQLDWLNLTDPVNIKHKHFMKTLNTLYRNHRSLWEIDHSWDGLVVLEADDRKHATLSYIRQGKNPRDFLVIVCNFKPHEHQQYRVGVPYEGIYEVILNTEMAEFGGKWSVPQPPMKTLNKEANNQPYSIDVILPALSVLIIRPKRIKGVNKRSINKKGGRKD